MIMTEYMLETNIHLTLSRPACLFFRDNTLKFLQPPSSACIKYIYIYIYIYIDAAKCRMGIQQYIALYHTSVIEVHPLSSHQKRLMCKDHIRGSFPTCLKELK